MQSTDLTDKLILVTGAAQGIGAAVARSLVQSGARVAGLDIQAEKLESLAETLRSQPSIPFFK